MAFLVYPLGYPLACAVGGTVAVLAYKYLSSTSAPPEIAISYLPQKNSSYDIVVDGTAIEKPEDLGKAWKDEEDKHVVKITRRDASHPDHQKIVDSLIHVSNFYFDPPAVVNKRLIYMGDAGLLIYKDSYLGNTANEEKAFDVKLDDFFKMVITLVAWGAGVGPGQAPETSLTNLCNALKGEFRKKVAIDGKKWKSVKMLLSDGDNLTVLMCSLEQKSEVRQKTTSIFGLRGSRVVSSGSTEMFVAGVAVLAEMWDDRWRHPELEDLIFVNLKNLQNGTSPEIRDLARKFRKEVHALKDRHLKEEAKL